MCGLVGPCVRLSVDEERCDSVTTGRDPAAAFEDFWELWVRFLGDARTPGTVVVVEGERDRRALRRLGVLGPIVLVHRGRTIAETAQALEATPRRVIVLTDWDTEGGHLAQRLKLFLGGGRSAPDLEYRRRLAHLLRGELAHVEGLYGWAVRAGEKAHRSVATLLEGVEADADRPTE